MRMKSKVAFHILFIYFGELSDNLIPKINDINVRSWLVCKWTKITSGFWEDLCILLSNQLLHKGIQLIIKRPLFYFIVKMDFIVMGIRESWQLLGRSSFPTKETKESSFYLSKKTLTSFWTVITGVDWLMGILAKINLRRPLFYY